MQESLQFYIDGRWVDPVKPAALDVIDPSTEEVIGRISLGSAEDVDRAAKAAQAAAGVGHLNQTIAVLKDYAFQEQHGTTLIAREPVGVCGFITPWNWPVNQIMCKVAPALAAGCTMVLKPSEIAPLDAILLAEIFHAAGVPAGVFNLVNGDGPNVGAAIASHPEIGMVSFTGSTRAGVQVAMAAAPTVKRVAQELGGKSANVILDDADFQTAIAGGVQGCVMNSGQSCNAPTRMLVPASRHDEAVAIAKAAAAGVKVGPASAEGATLVTGGVGRPDGLTRGYYVKPTIFANVKNDMTIAREEIFGPVLAILPYRDEEEAIRIANDTPYGLSGYVTSGNLDRARRVASRLRTGNVHLNGAGPDFTAPFGGYKHSGNGREWGRFGFEEFLEVKAVMGYEEA